MDISQVITLIFGLVSSGAIIGFFRVRAENQGLVAAATKTEAEAESIGSEAIQARYDKFFDSISRDLAAVKVREEECQKTLAKTLDSVTELRLQSVEQFAAIARLRIRLEQIEADSPTVKAISQRIDQNLSRIGDKVEEVHQEVATASTNISSQIAEVAAAGDPSVSGNVSKSDETGKDAG